MPTVSLEPVDSVTVTTLVDNVTDMLLQDQGPAKRPPLGGPNAPRLPAALLEGGEAATLLGPSTGSPSWSRSPRAGRSAASSSTPV
jgi:hypothetical protein